MKPLILWFRRDLRLDDHPMLAAAAETGQPVLPVFIADDAVTGLGAAARWRMGEAVSAFARRLARRGLPLVLRQGDALTELMRLVQETDASGVLWTRLYDPASIARDTAVKEALAAKGLTARSFAGFTLAEPWQVETGAGGFFKVYTPFWRALSARGVPAPVAEPVNLRPPATVPRSARIEDWRLGAAMNRGAPILARHAQIGEEAAQDRLTRFLDTAIDRYKAERDMPAAAATSGLSENLTYGEIGPRRLWHAALAIESTGPANPGAEHFRKELAWRDFAHHLVYHTPHIMTRNWREDWDGFDWRADGPDAERWRRGMTGEPFVDAGLREMYVTGTMHNRLRMIVASYLTKHLLTHWRVGQAWFDACLTDWDPAANAMGWQWVAGSGPDAAPYFRVFNPATQAEKFDPDAIYRKRFIAELLRTPPPEALAYFDAAPRAWGLSPTQRYPMPMIDLGQGRERALAAYAQRQKPE